MPLGLTKKKKIVKVSFDFLSHCRYSEIKKAFQCEICCSLYVQKLVGRFAAVPEKISVGPIQIPAVPKMKKNFECDCDSTLAFQNGFSSSVPEKKDSDPEKNDSVPEKKDSVLDKKGPVLQKKLACENCGSNFFLKKLDGNLECKSCDFQKFKKDTFQQFLKNRTLINCLNNF